MYYMNERDIIILGNKIFYNEEMWIEIFYYYFFYWLIL